LQPAVAGVRLPALRATREHVSTEVVMRVLERIGGAEGDRTPDLMTASSRQAIFLNRNN
jgi:hypothetical protein